MTRLIAPSFSGYKPAWLTKDLIAGLTVWAVLIPEGLAYATIAGLPPVTGLYAAVPALALYLLLGSSRQLIVAPMSTTAAVSAGIMATIAPKDDAAAFLALSTGLALATSILAFLAGLLRLGFLAAFISEPVLKGFIIGLAMTIVIGQVPDLIGIEKGSGNFFEKLWHVLTHLGEMNGLTVAVGLAALALLFLLRRFVPLVPGALAIALLGIGAVALFGLDQRGLEIVGNIQSGLPKLGLPDITFGDFLDLLGPAVGIMLVGFAEGLGAAKTYAAREGYDVDPNRELLGLGIANLGTGLASGMVVNGSLSKTAVNGSAGAKSQFSSLTAAVLTLLTLLFLTGLFEKLPEAVLAAIVIAAVIELIDFKALKHLWQVRSGRLAKVYQLTARVDFVAALAALLGVLIFDTLPGLMIGIGVSIALLIGRTSRPHIAVLAPVGDQPGQLWVDTSRNPDYQPVPSALVVRVEASLLFANAEYVRDKIKELAGEVDDLRIVVLDGRTIPTIDVTAASALIQLRTDLRAEGADLALAQNVGRVRDVLSEADPDSSGPIYPTIDDALEAVGIARGAGRSPGSGESRTADDEQA